MLAAVAIVTRGARPVTAGTIPAGLAAVAGAVGGGANVTAPAGTTPKRRGKTRAKASGNVAVLNPHRHPPALPTSPRFAAASVGPWCTDLFAEGTLEPRVAPAEASVGVTAAVPEVAGATPVATGPPPAGLALARTSALVARRQVAAAGDGALQAPVAPQALTPASQLVAARPRGPPADTLTGFGAGGVPPALLAGAIPVDGVAAAVPGALAGVLAERPPAVGVAVAIPCGRVAPTM